MPIAAFFPAVYTFTFLTA
jgi:hypothetical protein